MILLRSVYCISFCNQFSYITFLRTKYFCVKCEKSWETFNPYYAIRLLDNILFIKLFLFLKLSLFHRVSQQWWIKLKQMIEHIISNWNNQYTIIRFFTIQKLQPFLLNLWKSQLCRTKSSNLWNPTIIYICIVIRTWECIGYFTITRLSTFCWLKRKKQPIFCQFLFKK